MKKISIILVIALAAIAANVNAQTMIAGGVDTVSVGSIMPYAVTPDANIKVMVDAGMLQESQFDWQIASGKGTINTAQSASLALYPDSILITWDATPGTDQVSVAENSVKSSSVLCTGGTQTLNVAIVALPELNATFDTAACGVNDYDVPVDLKGYGPWTISYKVTYTDLGSNTSDQDYTKIVGSVGDSDGTYDLPVKLTSFPSAGSGQYEVTITNIDDRISLKALNDISGTATASIEMVAAPTPNTGAIRHIEN